MSKPTTSPPAPGTTDETGPLSSATLSTLATAAVTPAPTPDTTPAATPAASSATAAWTRAAEGPSATPTPAAATATDGASPPSTDDAVARAAWHAFFRHYYASAYKRVAASTAEAASTGGVAAPSAPVDRKSVNKLLARWWRSLPADDQRPWLAAATGVVAGGAGGDDERGCNANGTSATVATPAAGTGGDAGAGETTGGGAAALSTVAAATLPPSASAAAAMDLTGDAVGAATAASGTARPTAATPAATASASESACPPGSYSEAAAGAAAGVSNFPFFPSFLPAPVPGATPSDVWPKTLADAAVTCMCTSSSARSMAVGDSVILSVGSLERAGRAPTGHARERLAAGRRAGGRSGAPTPPLSSSSAPPSKVPPLPPASAMAIVRFVHRGSEVGKLSAAIAQPLGLLLSAGLVTVAAATVAELPPGGARFGASVTLRLRLALHRLVFPAAVGGGVGVAAAAAEAAATRGGGGGGKGGGGGDGVAWQAVLVRLLGGLGMIDTRGLVDGTAGAPPGAAGATVTAVDGADDAPGAVSEDGREEFYDTVEQLTSAGGAGTGVGGRPSSSALGAGATLARSPRGLTATLRPYQAAGVAWMVARERYGDNATAVASGDGDEDDADTAAGERLVASARRRLRLHPLWRAYASADGTPFYVNVTSAVVSLDMPAANPDGTLGGILADEMGLGKTVMTIATILANRVLRADGEGFEGVAEEEAEVAAAAAGVTVEAEVKPALEVHGIKVEGGAADNERVKGMADTTIDRDGADVKVEADVVVREDGPEGESIGPDVEDEDHGPGIKKEVNELAVKGRAIGTDVKNEAVKTDVEDEDDKMGVKGDVNAQNSDMLIVKSNMAPSGIVDSVVATQNAETMPSADSTMEVVDASALAAPPSLDPACAPDVDSEATVIPGNVVGITSDGGGGASAAFGEICKAEAGPATVGVKRCRRTSDTLATPVVAADTVVADASPPRRSRRSAAAAARGHRTVYVESPSSSSDAAPASADDAGSEDDNDNDDNEDSDGGGVRSSDGSYVADGDASVAVKVEDDDDDFEPPPSKSAVRRRQRKQPPRLSARRNAPIAKRARVAPQPPCASETDEEEAPVRSAMEAVVVDVDNGDDVFEPLRPRRQLAAACVTPAVAVMRSTSAATASGRRGGTPLRLGGLAKSLSHLSRRGGTLVVCPLSLLAQWVDELAEHVAPGTLRVLTYYGSKRGTRGPKAVSLVCADVVVTTYQTLAAEAPLASAADSGSKGSGGVGGDWDPTDGAGASSTGAFASPPPPLFGVTWTRVVLDEAHTIKSASTRAARAAYLLRASRRWCLTGTPIVNTLDDVQSLLRFLQAAPWSEHAHWKARILDPLAGGTPVAVRAAQMAVRAILRPVMLRRRKSTRDSEGRPIVDLPPKTLTVVPVKLSPAERDFYDALYQRSKTRFDAFVAAGRVFSNYASVLEILLRLRQCCDHPYLVLAAPSKDLAAWKDLTKLATRFVQGGDEAGGGGSAASLARERYVRSVLMARSSPSVAGVAVGTAVGPGSSTGALSLTPPSGTTASATAATGTVAEAAPGTVAQCPICLDGVEDGVLPPCCHELCRSCAYAQLAAAGGGPDGTSPCALCREPFGRDGLTTAPRASKWAIDVDAQWVPSAKITAALTAIRAHSDDPEAGKAVLFSQWTSCLDLVEVALRKEAAASGRPAMQYVRLDGSCSAAARATVLASFAATGPGTPFLMLVSLKAGGTGLNLTAANLVVLLDPWWNWAVEAQAVDRTCRIGQARPVKVLRLVVESSVELRMLRVQERKSAMVDGAVGTADERRAARLEDVMMLFS